MRNENSVRREFIKRFAAGTAMVVPALSYSGETA